MDAKRILAFMKHAPVVAELRIGQRGPVRVFQAGRLMGTVPGWPVRSSSLIYDVRPDDFIPRDDRGEGVLDAHRSLGPGDFAVIVGFEPADEMRDFFTRDAADIFDTILGSFQSGGAKQS